MFREIVHYFCHFASKTACPPYPSYFRQIWCRTPKSQQQYDENYVFSHRILIWSLWSFLKWTKKKLRGIAGYARKSQNIVSLWVHINHHRIRVLCFLCTKEMGLILHWNFRQMLFLVFVFGQIDISCKLRFLQRNVNNSLWIAFNWKEIIQRNTRQRPSVLHNRQNRQEDNSPTQGRRVEPRDIPNSHPIDNLFRL